MSQLEITRDQRDAVAQAAAKHRESCTLCQAIPKHMIDERCLIPLMLETKAILDAQGGKGMT